MKKTLFGMAAISLCAAYAVFAQQAQYTYNDTVKQVLAENCSSCHSWHEGYKNLVGPLSEYAPTTGLRIVNPAKPDSSVLVWRLEGKRPNGSALEQMPKFGKPLSAETINMIRDWIGQGAPESKQTAVKKSFWGAVKSLFR